MPPCCNPDPLNIYSDTNLAGKFVSPRDYSPANLEQVRLYENIDMVVSNLFTPSKYSEYSANGVSHEYTIKPFEVSSGAKLNRFSQLEILSQKTGKTGEKQDIVRRELRHDYNSSQMIALQMLASTHAYQGLSVDNNSKTYIVSDGENTITASEGYLGIGIGYLTMNVSGKGRNEQYTLLVKHDDDSDRKVEHDENIVKNIEKAIKAVKEKKNPDEEIIKAIAEIAGSREKEKNQNLSVRAEQMEFFREAIRRRQIISERTEEGKTNKIIMLDEERETVWQRIRKIEIVENYSSSYNLFSQNYIKKLEAIRKDFTPRAPFKTVHKFAPNEMGSVLGFTYIGENFMGIRDDLTPDELHEVELHEAIHTPDEYETRVITKWMLDNETKYH